MSKTFCWFAARVLFEARCSDEEPELYEERILLVRAESGIEEAEVRARKLAAAAKHAYENEDGQTVTWAFKDLLDVVQLNETSFEDGSAVYHHFLTAEEATSVRESLKPGSLE